MSLVSMIEGGGPLSLDGPKPDPAGPVERPGLANILGEARVAGEIAALAMTWGALKNAPKCVCSTHGPQNICLVAA